MYVMFHSYTCHVPHTCGYACNVVPHTCIYACHVPHIRMFCSTDAHTIEELSEKLKTSHTVIRRRIAYWLTHGVLKEEGIDTYTLNKDHTLGVMADVIEEDAESAMASAEQQREEEFQVCLFYLPYARQGY